MSIGPADDHEFEDDYDDRDPEAPCHTCGGEGLGIIGEDWPARDIDLGRCGEVEDCPNCRGSGLAKDCTYW